MITMLVPETLAILNLDAATMPSLVMIKVNVLKMVVTPIMDVGTITSIAMITMLVRLMIVLLKVDVPMNI
jgi:hypothetical protein